MDVLKKIIDNIRKMDRKEVIFGVLFAIVVYTTISFIAAPIASEVAASKTEEKATEVQYSEFLGLVDEKKIVSAEISKEDVEAVGTDGTKYIMKHDRWLYTSSFPKDLREAGVKVDFSKKNSDVSPADRAMRVVGFVIQSLFWVFMIAVIFMMIRASRGGGATGSWPPLAKDVTVKFADVAGQNEPKFELAEIKDFLTNPAAYDAVGAKPPRGLLMVGPPGTGKTLLAKALAGEARVNFMAVTGSDFAAMFVGVGRNKVERLFKQARKNAPCIIFIDEIDSVGARRGGGSSDAGREKDTTLNQILTEMDGFNSRDGVVVIGATNHVELLDPALLRPGRFDRHIHLSLSDMDGREEILAVHVKGKPMASDVNLRTIARGTPGFSGADLENLVNEAAILAARSGLKEITAAHFEEARDKVLMGLQRNSMVLDDAERQLIAVHEAGHAVVACLTPHSDPVHQATIIPRGRSLGLVMRLPERDRISVPKSKLMADLYVAMAGRAAEELVFGADHVTTGASADIEMATNLARKMVGEWGMSNEIGMVRTLDPTGKPSPDIDKEVRKLIDGAYAQARELLATNKDKLDAVTNALLERKTLDGDEVRELVDLAA